MLTKKSASQPHAAATVSRRTVLSAGFGLAAAACGGAGGPQRAAPDPFVDSIRDSRRVVGRVSPSPDSRYRGPSDNMARSHFPQPPELTLNETDTEKNVTLEVSYLDVDIVKRDSTIVRGQVRAYNRKVPGPTIRCDSGDRLNIMLRNNLPANESFPYDYDECTTIDADRALTAADAGLPHGFNTTNLHTHGLHVSPASLGSDGEVIVPPYTAAPALASDDIHLEVPPGEEQAYCIVLPTFHAPGTHWYHAHKHGSASLQVNNGLVGALIVRERGNQRILGDQQHEDQILLIQEIMERNGDNDQSVYAQTPGDTSQFFVNGEYQPSMRMQTGEIQRWRFVNATSRPRGLAKLRLVKRDESEPLQDTSDLELSRVRGQGLRGSIADARAAAEQARPELFDRLRTFQRIARENAQPLHLIAIDGVSLYGRAPREVLEWDFAPGNRADFLVQVNEPGQYAIVKDLHSYADPTPNPEVQILAFVEVTQGQTTMQMPTVVPGDRPCYLTPIEDVDNLKSVDFQAAEIDQWATHCGQPVQPPWTCSEGSVSCNGETRDCNAGELPALLPRVFAMDCTRYDSNSVESKYLLELNTAEEWTLRNLAGGGHPFHIHVNPFQVVEIYNGITDELVVVDPLDAPWQDVVAIPPEGHVKIRQRYLTFPGDFVIHCHFLNHEDMGMMKRVRVVAAPDAPGQPPCQAVQDCSGVQTE